MRTARMLLGLTMLASAVCSFLAGCQRGPGPLNAVSGRVSYKGFPLQGGTIVFTPDTTRGAAGPLALGKINGDGSYQLFTGDEPGAYAGWFRVTVTSYSASSSQVPGQPFRPAFSLIPEKYRDPELSMLACEVKANRTNTIDFNLE